MKLQNKKARRGATAVEFAVAAPVMFFVLMSVFEFGWQILIRHTADNAAYEAARVAIVPGATAQDAVNEANRIMGIVGARSFEVDVTPDTLNENTQEVTVQIGMSYADNGLVASKILGNRRFETSSTLLTERRRQ